MKILLKSLMLLGFVGFLSSNTLAQSKGKVPHVESAHIREVVGSTGLLSYRVVIIVKGDDNDEVASITTSIVPKNPNNPKTCFSTYTLNLDKNLSTKKAKYYSVPCDITAERGICLFNGKESMLGMPYILTASFLNVKGLKVAPPVTETVIIDNTFLPVECPKNTEIQPITIEYPSVTKGETQSILINNIQINKANETWKTSVGVVVTNDKGIEETIYAQAKYDSKMGVFNCLIKTSEKYPNTNWKIEALRINTVTPCGNQNSFKLSYNNRGYGAGKYAIDLDNKYYTPKDPIKFDVDSVMFLDK